MNLISGQLSWLFLTTEDVCLAIDDGDGVLRSREEGVARDASKCSSEGLGRLGEAVGGDGTAFESRGDDLLGDEEA